MFADAFVVLPAGCYNVIATPTQGSGAASADCHPAHANHVEVVDGQTTEIWLANQCEGPPVGAIDVAARLNSPPKLEAFFHAPSKFVRECQVAEMCATFSDPNNDEMELVWAEATGLDLFFGPTVIVNMRDGNRITQCIRVVPEELGSYQFIVQAFDLARTQDGDLVRWEQILEEQGTPHDSRDSLQAPLHVGFSPLPLCVDDSGDLQSLPTSQPVFIENGCNRLSDEQQACDPALSDVSRTCPGGVFSPEAYYPACS
jgi:hypothetical protein